MNPSEAQERELMEQEMRDLRRRLLILERALDRSPSVSRASATRSSTASATRASTARASTASATAPAATTETPDEGEGMMDPRIARRRALIC